MYIYFHNIRLVITYYISIHIFYINIFLFIKYMFLPLRDHRGLVVRIIYGLKYKVMVLIPR